MSFNQFSNRSQNYGNVKVSKRDEIIAQSRQKRQERQKRKKQETAAKTIQGWYRTRLAYNDSIAASKQQFNTQMTSVLKQSSFTLETFHELLRLFNICLFGFQPIGAAWAQRHASTSSSSSSSTAEIDPQWFTMSCRRLYSVFLQTLKTGTHAQHFISNVVSSDRQQRSAQLHYFQFFAVVLVRYLSAIKDDAQEQQSVTAVLWNVFDCAKWKHFDSLSKAQQAQCQVFCHELLQFVFVSTSFLSQASAFVTQYMPLPQTSKLDAHSKTMLVLLHTIILRYFQFYKTKRKMRDMDIESPTDAEHKTDTNADNDEDEDRQAVVMICVYIVSTPCYVQRLLQYKLDSVIRSWTADHVWTHMIRSLDAYATQAYNSYIFQGNKNSSSKHHNVLMRDITFVSSSVCSANESWKHQELKQNVNVSASQSAQQLQIMDIPDFDDYDVDEDDSDDDGDDVMMQDASAQRRNVLQTYMNITEEQQPQMETEKKEDIGTGTDELYLNPNNKNGSLHRRKKKKTKRSSSRRKKNKAKQVVDELPTIIWTIHNLLSLYLGHKKMDATATATDEHIKTFVSFLNMAQTSFKMLDLVSPSQPHPAFPYDNLDCEYATVYLQQFEQWCGADLLSTISNLWANATSRLSLSDHGTICKFLLAVIDHFPASKEHQIWNNLNAANNTASPSASVVVLLHENVFCKYGLWTHKDWQSILKQFFNGHWTLSRNGKTRLASSEKRQEYNSCIARLEESTQCMHMFEVFLLAAYHELRIIDDEQFHQHSIPFACEVWLTFIETFKYICYVFFWSRFSHIHKCQSLIRRERSQRKHNSSSVRARRTQLSPIDMLELYTDSLEQFVSSVTSVFALLRDRNTRKSFAKDNRVWLMDNYIDLYQFEKEILNLSDEEMKHDHPDDPEQGDGAEPPPQQQQQQPQAFPQVFGDAFNPFSNREFGYDEMYGGGRAQQQQQQQNYASQSHENLRRFEDNFSVDNAQTVADDEADALATTSSDSDAQYRRSFLILTEIPFVIPFKLRVKLFYALIEYEKDRLESSGSSIRINRGNAIRATIARNNILDDGYRALDGYTSELKTLIQIEFQNEYGHIEQGIDGGGIFKEFLNELIKDAFDPQRGLFLQTEYRNELYPNPDYPRLKQVLHVDKDYYEFLGKMVGKAMFDRILIEPIFAQFFLRKLLSQHNYVDDLQTLDSDLYKQLMSVKHDDSNTLHIESMELTFCVTHDILGDIVTHNLIANGSNVGVTHDNRHKYINILADYKLNKCMSVQSVSFMQGMSRVVNLDYLRIFDATELSKLLSGDTNTELNWKNAWADLRSTCHYTGGFHDKHRCIKWFWEILNEDLSVAENQKLLQFVTSCTRSPLLGFKSLSPRFSIMCTGGDIQNLPTSQTCMNLFKLPNYPTKEMLKEKLLKSINSNAGFDLS